MAPITPMNARRVMTWSKNVSCGIVVPPSCQPICDQEKSARHDQTHYYIPPVGLSTDQASDHGNEPYAFCHVIEKLGRALSLPIAHISLDTGITERLKGRDARLKKETGG